MGKICIKRGLLYREIHIGFDIVGHFNSIDKYYLTILYYWIQKFVILLQLCDTSN